MKTSKPVYVVMPAYNEASHPYFKKTIEDVLKIQGLEKLVVISDGSIDKTIEQVNSLKEKNPLIELVSYEKNLGKEGALKKGFSYLANSGDFYEDGYIALMDADGQHKAEDVEKMLEVAEKTGADVVCSYRDFTKMPFARRIANEGIRLIFGALMGCRLKDVQSGLKIINGKHAKLFSEKLRTNGGYQVELTTGYEMFRNKMKVREVPITTEYEKCSKKSGMGLKNTKWIKQTAYAFWLAAKSHWK